MDGKFDPEKLFERLENAPAPADWKPLAIVPVKKTVGRFGPNVLIPVLASAAALFLALSLFDNAKTRNKDEDMPVGKNIPSVSILHYQYEGIKEGQALFLLVKNQREAKTLTTGQIWEGMRLLSASSSSAVFEDAATGKQFVLLRRNINRYLTFGDW